MKSKNIEQRKYIRLDAVFPVEFQFLDQATGEAVGELKQGFTRDVGKGGICLEVNNLEEKFEEIIAEQKAKLDLNLNIPLSHKGTKAIASIAWYKKIKKDHPNKYLIGLSFLEIDAKARKKIYFHARRIFLTPKLVSILILFLIAGLTFFYSSDFKLRRENAQLVHELVELSQKKSELEHSIIEFDSERKNLVESLSENQKEIEEYQKKVEGLKGLSAELKRKDEVLEYFEQDRESTKKRLKEALYEKARLLNKTKILSRERSDLKDKISSLYEKRTSAEDSLKEFLPSFIEAEERGISSMYKWIKNHQNVLTGLVVSFEGDKNIEDWAFTYDQSLAAQCFTLMNDQEGAQKILDFYKDRAEIVNGGYVNGYDAYTGKVVEYTVHSGPNIWLGLAVLQYTDKFKDEKYLLIAEDIAKWLISLQKEDAEFGIRGGSKFTWFSTEHNLDAYAFFGMLHEITEDNRYMEAQERTLKWIKDHAYNQKENRLNRGKGDATIATDTFAWAIAALGPKILKESGMDPDHIMDFAEDNCLVTVSYKRPDGEQLEITGFDFGKYKNLPRGGIVSTEWTAQMVVSLNMMAEYHESRGDVSKADYYKIKADFYLSGLQKMMIVSPSRVGQGEGCLPYASQDNVDTGHGWRIAKGSRTGSTAGTVYTIFAKHNYNPLMLPLSGSE